MADRLSTTTFLKYCSVPADRLKDMREEVIGSRADAKPAADILRELDRYCEPHSATSDIQAARPPTDTPLAEDPEMLAIYSELLDQRFPIVAFALSPIANDRAAAEETAGELAHGADMMGFEGLAEQLRAVGKLASTSAEESQRDMIISRFGELREQAGIIEEVTGIPSGAAALTGRARGAAHSGLYGNVGRVCQDARAGRRRRPRRGGRDCFGKVAHGCLLSGPQSRFLAFDCN